MAKRAATRKGREAVARLISCPPGPDQDLTLPPLLDRHQPLHFIGVGGIGMSALAGILAERGYAVSGSDPRDHAVLDRLRRLGVRVFLEQSATTVAAIRSGTSVSPLVVISSAVPETNPELAEARRMGLAICHRSDVLAALINSQPSIAVAGSHGKTTTSSLIATLLAATNHDPTAVIGGIVPAFGSNGRHGKGPLLVAEADESDGSLVKFKPSLAVLTNVELDHTDHYPNLEALITTLQRFAGKAERLLANRDCPTLRDQFQPSHWWSIESPEGVSFAAIAREQRGDGTLADFYEDGEVVGSFELPVAATLAMARLMVDSGRSPLPVPPRRLVAVFQPHRYSRTAQFLDGFAAALVEADSVLIAPLYAAGEAPIQGINSAAIATALLQLDPGKPVLVAANLEELAAQVVIASREGDLVLAMGAGDVNGLWDQLCQRPPAAGSDAPLAA